jgi:hypothetical protein
MQWQRRCRECGHKQIIRLPAENKELSDPYLNSKCRKCKSKAIYYVYDLDEVTEDYAND